MAADYIVSLPTTTRIAGAAVVIFGAGTLGYITKGPTGLGLGMLISVAAIAAITLWVWRPNVFKTVIAQFFFLPLTMLGAVQQVYFVAPAAPNPQITTVPLLFWSVAVCVAVHRFQVGHQWLRALLTVEVASFGGWLLVAMFGPWGLVAGYALSAALLTLLTVGWPALLRTGQSFKRTPSDDKPHAAGPALNAVRTPDGSTVLRNVVFKARGKEYFLPMVILSSGGIYVIDALDGEGVLKDDSNGVRIGSRPVDTELSALAIAAYNFARRMNVPHKLVMPVVLADRAGIRGGSVEIALFKDDIRLFDVLVTRSRDFNGRLANDPPRVSERLLTRTRKRAARLSSAPASATPVTPKGTPTLVGAMPVAEQGFHEAVDFEVSPLLDKLVQPGDLVVLNTDAGVETGYRAVSGLYLNDEGVMVVDLERSGDTAPITVSASAVRAV